MDGSGSVKDTYQLDAWGHQIASTGSTQNPYKYGAAWGYIADPSGLLQLGARFYWPELGRFVQRDPAKDVPGPGRSSHLYVDNRPLDAVDPNGWMLVGLRTCLEITANAALRIAPKSGLPGAHNGPQDAYRHCLWSCWMKQYCGGFGAYMAGTGHELFSNSSEETSMDMHNNRIGRRLGGRAGGVWDCGKKDCKTLCREALNRGELMYLSGDWGPANDPGGY